jgi:hypothetical protein
MRYPIIVAMSAILLFATPAHSQSRIHVGPAASPEAYKLAASGCLVAPGAGRAICRAAPSIVSSLDQTPHLPRAVAPSAVHRLDQLGRQARQDRVQPNYSTSNGVQPRRSAFSRELQERMQPGRSEFSRDLERRMQPGKSQFSRDLQERMRPGQSEFSRDLERRMQPGQSAFSRDLQERMQPGRSEFSQDLERRMQRAEDRAYGRRR